jgi:lysophospholipase L1-like esterase
VNRSRTGTRTRQLLIALGAFICLLSLSTLRRAWAGDPPATPTLFLIGDSTVKNGTKGLQGWGTSLPTFFDTTRIRIVNSALGGRSSRTFLTEGLWDKVRDQLKPGDFVIMQFGHNDGGSPKTSYRASLKGIGDDTQEVENPKTHEKETIHSYGWYLRKFVTDTKAKGATPIVCSLIPRNDWKDGKVARSETEGYGWYAHQVADAEKVPFIDLNALIADRYDAMGQEAVKPLFPQEHTHTSPEGAALNAECVAAGIRGLKDCPLSSYLLPAKAAATAAP